MLYQLQKRWKLKKRIWTSARDGLYSSDAWTDLQEAGTAPSTVHQGHGGDWMPSCWLPVVKMDMDLSGRLLPLHSAAIQSEAILWICPRETPLPSQIVILPKVNCFFLALEKPAARVLSIIPLSSQRADTLKRLPGLCSCWVMGQVTFKKPTSLPIDEKWGFLLPLF